jgi:hypothetical protein
MHSPYHLPSNRSSGAESAHSGPPRSADRHPPTGNLLDPKIEEKPCATLYHIPCGRCVEGGPCLAGKPLISRAKKTVSEVETSAYSLIHGNKSHTQPVTTLSDKVSELPGNSAAKDHKARLERYALAHKRAVLMSDWIAKNRKKEKPLISDLNDCGDRLTFRAYYTIQQIRLHAMHSCKKHILCPLCAIRRGAKSTEAYLARLEVIKESHPNIKAYLVTFTVKNGSKLKERFQHLQNSMKKYNLKRSNAMTSKKRLPVEANKALGAVWSYEFKVGDGSGLWHPHAHAVWLCYDAPDQEKLRQEWQAITGDSYIVNVTPFHNQADVIGGFLEVFKYALKFSDMPLEQNWHGYEVLNGRRLVASFGLFRGVQVPESLTDEPLEDLPYIELFYKYMSAGKYSIEKKQLVNVTPANGEKLPF